MCIGYAGCRSKYTALQNGKYYFFTPDYICRWQVQENDISVVQLNRSLLSRGSRNDTSKIIIHKTIKRGEAFNLYVEEQKSNKSYYYMLAILKDKSDIHMDRNQSFTPRSTEISKKDDFIDPVAEFCVSVYTQKQIDSFQHFRNISSIDTATSCQVVDRLKNSFKKSKTQIEKTRKFDPYLSIASKEVETSVLISFGLDPINYNNDEIKKVLEKCLK